MRVVNHMSIPVIAYSFDYHVGYSEDVTIQPREMKDVPAPLQTELAKCNFRIIRFQDLFIFCRFEDEESGHEKHISISAGQPIRVVAERGDGRSGIVIRHHNDKELEEVRLWREQYM